MKHDDIAMHYEVGLCMLAGKSHRCSPGVHLHHIVRKGWSEPELIAVVCEAANVGRIADSKWATKLLIQQKVAQHGEERMREVLANRGIDLDAFL